MAHQINPNLLIGLTLAATCFGATPFVSPDVPKNIPDNNAAGVTSTVTVSGINETIGDVNIILNVTHPCIGDLEISLTSPTVPIPVTFLVAASQGGILSGQPCGANLANTTFDDTAANHFDVGVAPYAGSYNPSHVSVGEGPLSAFNGRIANGEWTLKITDRAGGNVGTLTGWTLVIGVGTGPTQGTGLRFVPVTPCRLADTRDAPGLFGQPILGGGTTRDFPIGQRCGLPANASAYSLNVTVVPQGPLGYLTVWPTGLVQPLVSTLNSPDGRIKANAAIVPAGLDGAISVFVTNATHLVLDVNGYFIDPVANAQSLAFYPLVPCRVVDTRNPDGALGGPVITGGVSRSFPVTGSNCGVPANAQAYSLNATVVPNGSLGYLTLWPTGQNQPFVSTLNAPTGGIVANAAIVPAGAGGSVSAFVTNQSHLVIDINGYFAPPGAANAQRFFTVTPCRLLDTRNAPGEFGGPILEAGQSRSYRLPLTNCALPDTAAAYSLNATVVPTVSLGYLTLWPAGSAQPFVSTLNAVGDAIVANAALVPAGTAGGISSFVTDQSHLIVDTNGYFAP